MWARVASAAGAQDAPAGCGTASAGSARVSRLPIGSGAWISRVSVPSGVLKTGWPAWVTAVTLPVKRSAPSAAAPACAGAAGCAAS